jgi:hypothetical protein
MPQPGFFVLHPAVLPPLTADRYTLHGAIEDMPHGPVDPIDAQLVVSAPRFTMPPDQILSTFPPANRAGAFQDTLPQIVLKRRTLPWERRLDPADEQLPWLALVVIAEGEGSLSGESKVEDCVTPGTALPHPEDRDTATSVYLTVTQTVVNGVFPTKDDVRLLAHVREVDVADSELMGGDDDGFVAVVIANRLPQPGFDDQGNPVPKKYLACLVNLEGQAAVLPPPPPDPINFEFRATDVVQDLALAARAYVDHPDRFVMGPTPSPPQHTGPVESRPQTRPDTAKAAVRTGAAWAKSPAAIDAAAVSASAEHAPSLVRGAMASGWQIPVIVLEPTYRFPVLAHWSFTVSGDPTFEELMKGLDVGLIGTLVGDVPPKAPAEIEKQKHRAPPPASPRPEPELAETGHVGLPHQTRRGDHVRAWFRGPACAHPTVRGQPDKGRLPLAHTSDQLRIVVPDGREDVALAAAFEIGRVLALSQPAVVNALLRWRQEQYGAQRAAELAAEATIPMLSEILDHRQPGLGALVGRQFVLATAQQPDKVLAPARPLVDPGRPLTYARGDLNKLIADGLGFSLDQVTKAAQRIGVVAALADTPAASTDQREPALTGSAFAALQSDLDQTVNSIAADVLKTAPGPAAPGPAAPGPAAPAAPAAAAPRRRTKDALDRLLESQETR